MEKEIVTFNPSERIPGDNWSKKFPNLLEFKYIYITQAPINLNDDSITADWSTPRIQAINPIKVDHSSECNYYSFDGGFTC